MIDGFKRMFGQEWRDLLVCYVDDCLTWGYTHEQCAGRSRLLTVALRVLDKEGSEKIDKSVQEQGTVVGMSFTARVCTLDDSAAESVKVALDKVMQAKKVSGAMVR